MLINKNMCGIFSILNADKSVSKDTLDESFFMSKSRGPEFSILEEYNDIDTMFGFHRLAINGLNKQSNQPIKTKECILICNGEIYNYTNLYENFNKSDKVTSSDCEIIIHMYRKYGIEYTLENLDGVFSFVLIDLQTNTCFVARDPYGVRPLFEFSSTNKKNNKTIFGFSSELKQLSNIYNQFLTDSEYKNTNIKQFNPGHFYKLQYDNITKSFTDVYKQKYFSYSVITLDNIDYLEYIRNFFINAVKKRVIGTTERPIACLLSGGLDSSLVTSLVSKFVDNLETYSIGLNGSVDLKYAKKVAEYLNTKHKSIVLSEDEFFNAIPEVIKKIESYDTTTVRASVGNYLVAKYISENSDAKVIFNGDGSDELTGGYLYFHAAKDPTEFDIECKRLLKDIHYFDVLRSDRSISTNGLEPRTPFLDREWTQFYLSLPKHIRYHKGCKKPEKYLLREAFKCYLPDEVLFRTKEAFSDGVSSETKSWYEIINEKIGDVYKNVDTNNLLESYKNSLNKPVTLEQLYYRQIYDKYYPNTSSCIPYFWMPRFVEAKDASARTLKIYKEL